MKKELVKNKDDLPEWARWPDKSPPPRKWFVTNPETGERVIVYRSYADYVED
jgi:hypothetical protein